MRIFSIILRVSLIPLSLISVQSHPGYFMTRFPTLNKFFVEALESNVGYSRKTNPFAKMSSHEKKRKCSKFFKTRVFVNADPHMDEILKIKNEINYESIYDINIKKISIADFPILSYNCFSSKYIYFSLSPNYASFNEDNSYYPYFAYYTHRVKSISTVFAYIEENSDIVEDEEMDINLYKEITNKENSSLLKEYALLEMDENNMFRTCSAAATHVLPATSNMVVYEMQAQLINSDDWSELPRIILKTSINEEYYLHQPLLHCLLTDEDNYKIRFYIMLHPIEKNGGYIVEKINDIFRLKMRLDEVEKASIFFLRK